MPNTNTGYIAGGDLRPFRFCKLTDQFEVSEADANDPIRGVCGGQTNKAPLSDFSITPLHAEEGGLVQLYEEGEETYLELGDTVTVATEARLKSDADGRGVPVATSGTTLQNYGAIALQDGVAGDIIRVRVTPNGTYRPAIA